MVITHLNGYFGENCYVYADEASKEALVVDPGDEMDTLLGYLRPYELTHIFITHAHVDHISGLKELKEAFPGALICGHEYTRESLPDPSKNLSYRWGTPIYAPAPGWTYAGSEGQISACGQDWRCLFTPGHAYDHTAFYTGGILFGGDVIFEGGSYGRYDLETSSLDDLKKSLALVLALPPETRVYAGHGGGFTIGEARPFFRL